MLVVRPYRRTDRAAVADICVRTGAAGGDATGRYPDGLLAAVFAEPYAELEPERALVLADDAGAGGPAVGYLVGTADTARFAARYRTEWLPRVADRWPDPAGSMDTPERWMRGLLHRPERMLLPLMDRFPAHLHIDLLPAVQRGGHGRTLMTAFLAGLAADGVSGVHLTMDPANTAARAFYDRLGFRPARADETGDAGHPPGSVLVRDARPPDTGR